MVFLALLIELSSVYLRSPSWVVMTKNLSFLTLYLIPIFFPLTFSCHFITRSSLNYATLQFFTISFWFSLFWKKKKKFRCQPGSSLLYSGLPKYCVALFNCTGPPCVFLQSKLVSCTLSNLIYLFSRTISQIHSILEAFYWSVGKEFGHFLSHLWKEPWSGAEDEDLPSLAVGFILVRLYEAVGCERFVWPWPVWSLFL